MKIVILGMPGAGKGTVASHLEHEFGWKHVSTGDVLRAEVEKASPLGKRVQAILASGKLVDDTLMGEVVTVAIRSLDKGFILDGYPRTLKQCELLKKIIELDKVIYLHVDERTAFRRLLSRSQSASVKRSDDTKQVILRRLALFQTNNQPILDFYSRENLLVEINGAETIEAVHATVKHQLL